MTQREQIQHDYEIFSATTVFVPRLRGAAVNNANRRLRVIYRGTVSAVRDVVADKFAVALSNIIRPNVTAVLREMVRNGGIQRLAEHALRMYSATYRNTLSYAKNRDAYRKSLSKSTTDDEQIRREIRDARDAVNDFQDAVDDAYRVAFTLWHYHATHIMRAFLDDIGASVEQSYAFALSVRQAANTQTGFSTADLLTVEIIQDTFQELEEAILARINEIKLSGFTDAMYETVRETIQREVYNPVDGAMGATELAKEIGKDLNLKYGSALPQEAEERLMLWARTEGCVVQNDALMAISKACGLNGKQWLTVDDERVREAHISNEGDGVIREDEYFSDGSFDGGSGSVSPFMCRCVCSGAFYDGLLRGGKDSLENIV